MLVDPYGNYFCQKLFKVLDFEERLTFIQKIKDSVEFIGTDQIGAHSFQNLISGLCNIQERQLMVLVIQDSFKNIINDKLGVHIVERLIICFDEGLITNLYELVLENFIEYANDATTLCVVRFTFNNTKIRKIVSFCQDENTKKRIINILVKNYEVLVNNPYGNFSIQEGIDVKA